MANTLTNLIPDLFVSMDVVSRELVGMIPAVTRDSSFERAALNEIVRIPIAPAVLANDITPGVTPPDDGDQTIGNATVTITKARRTSFRWNGEQKRGINNGPGQLSIQQDQIAQALRTLTNEIEVDLAKLFNTVSRAYGTAGTTPFASDVGASAQARKILDDNGAPSSDRHLIIDTTTGANLRTLAQLTKANESGTTDILQQGTLINMSGLNIRESAQIQTPAIGTSNNAGTSNTAGYAIGATAITLAAAGTGTILAGDIVVFTGDINKYQVAPAGGVASLAAGGVLTLAAPGLRKALPTSATTVTVQAAGPRMPFFTRNAFVLAQRLGYLDPNGDLATDRISVQDPRSGLVFEIAQYPQYKQTQFEVSCAWGIAGVKPEHAGVLLG